MRDPKLFVVRTKWFSELRPVLLKRKEQLLRCQSRTNGGRQNEHSEVGPFAIPASANPLEENAAPVDVGKSVCRTQQHAQARRLKRLQFVYHMRRSENREPTSSLYENAVPYWVGTGRS